jgi:hypothetical protein
MKSLSMRVTKLADALGVSRKQTGRPGCDYLAKGPRCVDTFTLGVVMGSRLPGVSGELISV